MRKFSAAFFLLVVVGCGQAEKKQVKPQVKKPTEPVYDYYREHSIIRNKDTLQLFEGDRKFLTKKFGHDSCTCVVTKSFFFKGCGEQAVVSFLENPTDTLFYSIQLYFRDSKDGYDKSILYEWPESPKTVGYIPGSSDPLWAPPGSRVVDTFIVFKKLNK